MGKQKTKRQYPKRTSTGIALQPPEGYYARKAHVPIEGAEYNVVRQYIDLGINVFTLPRNSKVPFRRSHGHKDAVKHWRFFQKRWWHNFNDETIRFYHNFGVATGRVSNVTVIDSDGQQGEISISMVEELVGVPFPKTPTVTTPRGGKHRYYQYTPLLDTCVDVIPSVDIRSDNGYVVAASSQVTKHIFCQYDRETGECSGVDSRRFDNREYEIHPTHYATEYRFDSGCAFTERPIAKLPEIFIKGMLFVEHHPESRILENMMLLPEEERLRHIEEWYQTYIKNPPPEDKAIGILSKQERKLQKILKEIADKPIYALAQNEVQVLDSSLEESFADIQKQVNSLPPKVRKMAKTFELSNAPPTFAFPNHLLPQKEQPKRTIKEFYADNRKLYTWSPSQMMKGDGRNCLLASVIGLLWWYVGSDTRYLHLVWLWAQQYNLRLGEPLDGAELHKIFDSITSYKQYPKSAPTKSTKNSSKKPRPSDNITIATEESKIIVQAAFQAIEEGKLEKPEYSPHETEEDIYVYPEGYEHLLLPKLQEKYPNMRVEDITHSQKQIFNRALKNIFQWGPAVHKFKGHSRISTQIGFRLNIVPKSTAIEPSIARNLSMKDSTAVELVNDSTLEPISIDSTDLVPTSVEPMKVDPSKYFSAKEFSKLLATNKEFRRRWNNKKGREEEGLYESSVEGDGKKPFRVMPDWRREAERWYRQYMEWRFDIIH